MKPTVPSAATILLLFAILLPPAAPAVEPFQPPVSFEQATRRDFGENPFLVARMIERFVIGVQSSGTIATLKHFVANGASSADVRLRATVELVRP